MPAIALSSQPGRTTLGQLAQPLDSSQLKAENETFLAGFLFFRLSFPPWAPVLCFRQPQQSSQRISCLYMEMWFTALERVDSAEDDTLLCGNRDTRPSP